MKWVQWDYEQQRLRATRHERCSCAARDQTCPLCVEAWAGVEDPLDVPEEEDEGGSE